VVGDFDVIGVGDFDVVGDGDVIEKSWAWAASWTIGCSQHIADTRVSIRR